jgi:DNA mismatch repair protein MutL
MTSQKIHILPDFIANQIAAGEVVQRPESVVKELVENSLDAGADTIAVVVRGAGKKLIHAIDNGRGMAQDDLKLALKRHATSKIQTMQDLERIQTLGFRGEALASIASVASIEIRTKLDGENVGWRLCSEPNEPEVLEPFSAEKGTQIFVKNLFFNVPARRKFLKSDLTEFRYISDTMLKFAVSNPNVRFTFYDDDTLIFDAKPAALKDRICDVLGAQIENNLIEISFKNEFVEVTGFVGKPLLAKQSRAGQFLFLNGRTIVNRAVNHAVFSPFEHILDKNQHPFFVINLAIDPEKVDINVHPQKHEVKFDDDRVVYNAVQQAVGAALQSNHFVPEVRFREQVAQSPFEKMRFGAIDEGFKNDDMMLVNRLTGEIVTSEPAFQTERNYNENTFKNEPFKSDSFKSDSFKSSNGNYSPPRQQNSPMTDAQMTAFEALFQPKQTDDSFKNEDLSRKTQQLYWQLHNKYIFFQSDKGVQIIDQHVAHERILYERAIAAMNKNFAYAQKLLFPVKIELSSSEMILLQELEEDVTALGYGFHMNEEFVEIVSVPSDVKTGTEENSLKELLAQYEEFSQIRHTGARDNLAASFACKASIKAGDALTVQEMKYFVDELFKTTMPYVCPHGRPVVIEFDVKEFDRRFGRTS